MTDFRTLSMIVTILGTCAASIPSVAGAQDFCVKQSELRSPALQPVVIRGALGISGSYCVAIGDQQQTLMGKEALTEEEKISLLSRASAYDDACGLNYGSDPQLAYSAAMMQVGAFGATNIPWVFALIDDCTLLFARMQKL
jgi:hypothetical protein